MPAAITVVVQGLEKLKAKLEKHSAAVNAAVSKEIRKGAILIETTAKLLIANSPRGGRTYKLYTKKGNAIEHHASAPGESPATRPAGVGGGQLVKGINTVIDPQDSRIAYVVSRAKYSFWLEFGTKRMRARPFLRPAEREHRAAISKNIRAAVRGLA